MDDLVHAHSVCCSTFVSPALQAPVYYLADACWSLQTISVCISEPPCQLSPYNSIHHFDYSAFNNVVVQLLITLIVPA